MLRDTKSFKCAFSIQQFSMSEDVLRIVILLSCDFVMMVAHPQLIEYNKQTTVHDEKF